MPQLRRLTWLLLASCTWWVIHVQALELRTAAQDSQPKYVLADNTMTGLCPDIWHALERVDPQLRFSQPTFFTPLARIELQLERGEIDTFCGLAKTSSRINQMEFLHPPIYATSSVLAARVEESQAPQNWDELRRLGATVLVTTNTVHAQVLANQPGITVDAGARDTSQNLQKLLAGRGRFFLHNDFALIDEIQRDGLADKVKVLPTPLFTEGRYIVMSRKADPAVKARITAALLTLQRNGELARIFATYRPR